MTAMADDIDVLLRIKRAREQCRERVCCPRLVARELSVLFAICFGDRECAVTKFYGRRT
jgi:hypothetical protein